MVTRKWRDSLVGSSSGVFQAAAYLEQQFVGPAAVLLALAASQLGWVTTLGYVLPILVGLLIASGDWFGGRPLIIGLAAVTLGGVALVFAGAVLAELHVRGAAIWLVAAGLVLMPASVRHGAMLVAHETHGLQGDLQLSRSRALRRYLVLGIYLAPLPAGVVAERFGWAWVFGPFALIQIAGLALLAGQLTATTRRPRPKLGAFVREFAGSLNDSLLLLAGAGAFLAQAVVFAYVSGLPVRLRAQGISTGWISLVIAGSVLAAPFVTRPRVLSSVRFGQLAGVLPLVALVLLEAVMLVTGVTPRLAAVAVLFAVAAAVIAGPLVELSKQFSQSIGQLQATAASGRELLYRRQAVVNLGANLGALTGTLVGRLTAGGGAQPWIGLLLGLAIGAWALQTGWFAVFPLAWKVRDAGPGRERWCYRGREFIIVTGAWGPGGHLSAIYDAATHDDQIQLDRHRASFDPHVSTVADQLQRARVQGCPARRINRTTEWLRMARRAVSGRFAAANRRAPHSGAHAWVPADPRAVSRPPATVVGAVTGALVPAEGPTQMSQTTVNLDRGWVNQAIATLRADAASCAETPLIPITGLPFEAVDIYVKVEGANPTGSLKHRLARELFLTAICRGEIGGSTALVDLSSGSTAVSEAYFARQLGLPYHAVMPRTTSPSKIALIEQHGGTCHLVDDPTSINDYARRLADQLGGYYVDQFTNAAAAVDWRGEDNLAAETARQMADRRHPIPAWIVVGAGTGGTASLFARHTRYHGRDSRLCVVDPENSAFFLAWTHRDRTLTGAASRIEGIGRPRVEPSFPHLDSVDHMVQVPDAASIATVRELQRWTGRRFGGSTGSTIWGALQLAADMHARGQHGSILVIAGDAGDRYSDTYYNDQWLAAQGLDTEPYQRTLRYLKATGEWLDPR